MLELDPTPVSLRFADVLVKTSTAIIEGLLADSSGRPLPNNRCRLTFTFYANARNGSPLWSEHREASLRNGWFCVLIGLDRPLDLDGRRFLGLRVGEHPELAQRLLLKSGAPADEHATVHILPT